MRKQNKHRKLRSHLLMRHEPSTTTTEKNGSTSLKSQNTTKKDQTDSSVKNSLTNSTLLKSNTTKNETKPPCKANNRLLRNNSAKNSTKYLIIDCEQEHSSGSFPWVPIICVLLAIGMVAFIVWLIWSIKKRIETTKKYNETPQNFIENPQLSLNQTKNLKTNKIQAFKKYNQKDCVVEQKTEFGGSVYEVSFKNGDHQKFSAVYWSKQIKTDSYFEIQIDTLDSEIEFGFVGMQYFGQLNDGIETKISRVGVSLNSEGHLQVNGETKYHYKWNLQYGDVIGMGLTNIDGNKRVWITKNGILLNPPTQDQVEKWLTKQELSNSHRDAYNNFNMEKSKHVNRKEEIDLMKRKIILPSAEEFNYYAVVGSRELTGCQMGKTKKFTQDAETNKDNLCTKLRINVGGKVFRLRDHNLKSGLLADPIQKNQFCNWLPCY